MTAKVLAKITERFGVDDGFFDAQDDMRLIAELREALFDDDVDAPAEATDAQAISGLVASHPAMAQAMVNLHRRYRIVTDQLAAATDERGDRSRRGTITAPHEEVRDFFYQRRNYIHELDVAAEEMTSRMRMHSADIRRGIAQRLSDAHGVTIVTRVDMGDHVLHNFDPETRRLDISNALSAGGRTFRLAAELAYLEFGDLLDGLVAEGNFSDDTSRSLALTGLASYFAAAAILPYPVPRRRGGFPL